MRFTTMIVALAVGAMSAPALADEISIERGQHISIIGGCHDCHTEGYSESEGKIDPAKALTGSSMGLRGPWGTTYPLNLRLDLKIMSEDRYVQYMMGLRTKPPMPWWNVRGMDEGELRSLTVTSNHSARQAS